MPTLNDAHRNAIVDATADVFDGGSCLIQTTGGASTLATITLPTPAFGAATGGSAAKAGTWSATASVTGVPARYVLQNSGATQTRTGTAGTSGTEMILTGLVGGEIVSGGTVTVTAYDLSQPAS